MTYNNPEFKQPPWVYGPKETMDWIEATHPTEKKGKKHEKKRSSTLLRNMHIYLDFDVEQNKISPPNIFSGSISKITGNIYVEDNFDLISTAEIVLRALNKAKFKHTTKIIIDKKVKHDHTEITTDSKKIIDILRGIYTDFNKCKIIEITAHSDNIYSCTVYIKIKKVHKKKEHAIEIQTKGLIKEELYHEFLNYLNDKLKVKKQNQNKMH